MTDSLQRKFCNSFINNYLEINMMDDGIKNYRAKIPA